MRLQKDFWVIRNELLRLNSQRLVQIIIENQVIGMRNLMDKRDARLNINEIEIMYKRTYCV